MEYPKHKIVAFPPLDKLATDYFPLSSGSYIKIQDMTDDHLLDEMESYKYNSNLLIEMTIRLFRDKIKES